MQPVASKNTDGKISEPSTMTAQGTRAKRMSPKTRLKAYKAGRFFAAVLMHDYPEYLHPRILKAVDRLCPARHSPDYRSVRWFGRDYAFTPAQAVIIRQLWLAWENGTPIMGAAALLETADMISDRISNLFKVHAAWGEMVKTDSNGHYWLQEFQE